MFGVVGVTTVATTRSGIIIIMVVRILLFVLKSNFREWLKCALRGFILVDGQSAREWGIHSHCPLLATLYIRASREWAQMLPDSDEVAAMCCESLLAVVVVVVLVHYVYHRSRRSSRMPLLPLTCCGVDAHRLCY